MEIYNTTWWGNAIDTAITAGTEPDFFGSQMKMLTSQQPELIVNGDFATDSDWTKATGWTISDGAANATNAGTGSPISQYIDGGKTYKITYDVISLSQGAFQIDLSYSGTALGQLATTTGTFTDIITSINASLSIRAVGTTTGSIDNISVKLARAEEVEAVKCLADWIHTTALQDLNN